MIPDGWMPHRRGDGEVVGYVRQEGESFVAVDLFGHDLTGATDWHEAESTLEETGLAWLAEPWMLRHADGSSNRVLILEVSPRHVLVKLDDFSDMSGREVPRFEVPVPVPAGVLTKAPTGPREWSEVGDRV